MSAPLYSIPGTAAQASREPVADAPPARTAAAGAAPQAADAPAPRTVSEVLSA